MVPSKNYPKDWAKRRRQVFERDSWECQLCANQESTLHCHHKRPISLGGSHSLENLITLCEKCHDKHHEHNIFGESAQNLESSGPGKKEIQKRKNITGEMDKSIQEYEIEMREQPPLEEILSEYEKRVGARRKKG